jgi:hypothetical protein
MPNGDIIKVYCHHNEIVFEIASWSDSQQKRAIEDASSILTIDFQSTEVFWHVSSLVRSLDYLILLTHQIWLTQYFAISFSQMHTLRT